ncbi:GNAT family N-acetyltransferase [Kineosporia sp. A_224]|uniref:GNAT family N-acetyltransferase n=1 Tax=Kineosporia sp. A_224 TaxID=1962180 RepID=UPI0013041FCB|nr:GNAT family N-acetyltransferase [Kineosporia sp. A_224]
MDLPPWAPTLSDGVVTLRAHRPDDVPAVVAACRDPQTVRWTTVPQPYGDRHGEQYVATRREEWDARRSLTFAVEDADGSYAGAIDLRPDGATPSGAEVGYAFAAAARGQGMASRALRLVCAWGFAEAGIEVVQWRAAAGNWASRRVAWAAGFRMEGLVRGLLTVREEGADGWTTHRADAWVGSLRRGEPMTPAHAWLAAPVLADGTVRLRPHRQDDAARMVEACSDAATQAWLPDLPARYSEVNALAHLEEIRTHHADGVALYWAFTAPGRDTLAGEVGLFGLSPVGATHSVEIGYWTHPDSRRLGLTTAAVRLAVRHALLPQDVGGLGARRALVRAADGNVASQRVAEKAGLRPCGRDREVELLRDGRVCDLLRYDLVASEQTLDEEAVAG